MARLGDICSLQSGGTPTRNNPDFFAGHIPWITTVALNGDIIDERNAVEMISEKAISNSAAKVVPPYSIMVGTRVGIGKVAINKVPMSTSQDIISLIGIDESAWDRKYLLKFIQGKSSYLISQARGATIKGIKAEVLADMVLPQHTLPIQRRIAATLDKVSEGIALCKQMLADLDELVKSQFIELFGDVENNPKGIRVMKWNDVFLTKTGKLDSNAMVEGGQYPFFTCAKEAHWIDKYAFDCEALLLAGNNAVGVYDVKHYKGKFNAYQRTYVLQLKDDSWSYEFFKNQLELKLEYLRVNSLGSNTRYLTMKILGEIAFLVPDTVKQNEWARFIQQSDKSKLAVQHQLAELETLKKSLMQEYFGYCERKA